jgi:hypothetical protein
MKQELTIEAIFEPGDGLLSQVAQALRATPLSPECFVWSAIPNTGEARIWMTLSEGEAKLHELTTDLRRIPGVRRVAIHGPGQSIKEALQ